MVSESNGGLAPPQELESFLPQDGKKEKIVTKYKISKDVESDGFDPFAERILENPTSNTDTLAHLLKASLGTGILAMPKAFQCAGLVTGVFFTILAALVCTHCSYVLIKCAHVLYMKTRKCQMSFPEVAEASFANGPQVLRRWSYAFRIFIIIALFATYFGTCTVYTVIIAKNISQVVTHYMESELDIRFYIIFLLPPLIFMVWIRNLKFLAPVSMVANILMGVGLGITFYYLVGTGGIDINKVKLVNEDITQWPIFFSLTIFAMEAIGVVMPLENAMRTPRAMLGGCGVLNMGMSGVTLVYMLLGILGYLRYPLDVHDNITLNLDINEIPAQVVKIAIAVAVYCTFGLQFFVCIEIVWNGIKEKFTNKPDLADYIMRTIMVTVCVLLAAAVPTIGPLMSVIGAFFFSILGLLAPVVIEMVTYWDIGYGRFNYLIWKNILVFAFGIFALIFGTKEAIIGIIDAVNQ